MAREVSIPEATLRVHQKRCKRRGAARRPVVQAPAELALPAVAIPSTDPRAPIMDELRSIHAVALEAYQRAVAAEDDRTIALLVQQLRNNLKAQSDLLAKLHRDDRPPEERLAENAEWLAFLPRLITASDRCCPGCRELLRGALEANGVPVAG